MKLLFQLTGIANVVRVVTAEILRASVGHPGHRRQYLPLQAASVAPEVPVEAGVKTSATDPANPASVPGEVDGVPVMALEINLDLATNDNDLLKMAEVMPFHHPC